MGVGGRDRGDRRWRALRQLLPAWYRDRFADDLLRLHRDRAGGEARGMRFWAYLTWDVVVTALQTRWSGSGPSRRGVLPPGEGGREPGGAGARTRILDGLSATRLAVRNLGRRPGYAAASVVTLAVGAGITTAVGALVHTVVLAPIPYEDPDRVVQITRRTPTGLAELLPPADVTTLREAMGNRLELGISRFRDVTLGGPGVPVRVRGVVVTAGTLSMLGTPPLLGRLPSPDEDVPGGECVTVLGHGTWRDRFGADPDVVGRSTRLSGAPCRITGVMPAGFRFPGPYFAPGELWLLAGPSGVDGSERAGPGLLVFGRVAPGVDHDVLKASLEAVPVAEGAPGPFTAVRWAAGSRAASAERLSILLAGAILVLLVAAVNFATLQLARAVDREGEIKTRLALGASRSGLVRLVLVEIAILTAAGAGAALLVSGWSVDLILALRSFWIPRMDETVLDGPAVALCLTLAAGMGAVAALVSSLPLALPGRVGNLARSSRGGSPGPRRRRMGRVLVTVETGLALLLVTGTALLVRSYQGLTTLDLGFRSEGLLHARVAPVPEAFPDDESRAAFYRTVEERLVQAPGIRDAALVNVPPALGAGPSQPFALAGETHEPGSWPRTVWRTVSGRYLELLGVPLVRGRGLDEARDMPRAALVNEAFVRRFLPDGPVLGTRLARVSSPRDARPEEGSWTVVGVVADIKEDDAHTPAPPAVYTHYRDAPLPSMAILARTVGPPLARAEELRRAVADADPDQPVYAVRDLDYILRSEFDLNRLGMTLMGGFALAALLLAVAAIYGVVSHSVGRRIREMGIRVALGAERRDVVRLVVWENGAAAVTGVAAGLLLVVLFGDVLRILAPGWRGPDPAVLALTAAAVTGVAMTAAWIPARRAARVDPVEVLRRE